MFYETQAFYLRRTGSNIYISRKSKTKISLCANVRIHKMKKNKTKQKQNTICVGRHYTQTNTNEVNKTCAPYKQQQVKTNRTSCICGNCNGFNNTELKT